MQQQSQMETAPARRGGRGCGLVVVLLLVLLALSAFFNLIFGAGCLLAFKPTATQSDEPTEEFPKFEEIAAYGSGNTKAVWLTLEGIIARETQGGFFAEAADPVTQLLRQIRAASNDADVRAIVLEMDSPGGMLTPTDEIYRALQEFRASKDGRLVLVYVRDMAASGAFYVAMASDWIIAEPTAVVGSIGVMLQTLNWQELSTKIGIKDVTITAGANKDMLNPFREVKPEHVAILQDILDEMHARFVGIVRERLALDGASAAQLADGRIFSASKAMAEGMINQIGYWEDALAKTREMLGVSELRVVRYESAHEWWRCFSRFLSSAPLRLPSVWSAPRPRLWCLWTP